MSLIPPENREWRSWLAATWSEATLWCLASSEVSLLLSDLCWLLDFVGQWSIASSVEVHKQFPLFASICRSHLFDLTQAMLVDAGYLSIFLPDLLIRFGPLVDQLVTSYAHSSSASPSCSILLAAISVSVLAHHSFCIFSCSRSALYPRKHAQYPYSFRQLLGWQEVQIPMLYFSLCKIDSSKWE